jgi:predicted nucleic acid-binding protein
MALAAVLDANVLYPIALTDFFLTLAGRGLFRPHWSTEILHEVARSLLRHRPSLSELQLQYRFTQMNRAFPGAMLDPPAQLVAAMTNDAKDRHVLATAIAAGAAVVVTFNTDDFAPGSCRQYGVEPQHPDAFAEHLVALDPTAAVETVREMSGRTERPRRDVAEIVERLQRDLPSAIERLIPVLGETTRAG